MKKIIFLLTMFLCTNLIFAQKMTDNERLAIAVWVPEQIEGMPIAARANLENKLSQIVTANGMSADAWNSRFIMTANVTVLTKDITSTAPPMQAYTLEVTFYIGDGFEGKSFASYSTTIKGVGETETKAYMMALKNIKTNNPAYQDFIEKGKTRIIEYFNAKCDFIIKEAQTKAGMNEFDQAIWQLTSVPDVCTECWNKCMDAAGIIYQQKIDYECTALVAQANNIWSANQSWEGAEEAAAILSMIDPDSKCAGDAKVLSDKIAARIKEIDKREWDFKYDLEIGLERDRIKAYRDIGVAWGNGQPQNVTYKTLW